MYTCATMAYSIQLQTTLTDICGVQKQEKSIQTSNKKHFMKNVKECRDVNRQKKYQNKVGMLLSHLTHPLDLIALLRFGRCCGSKGCVMCDDTDSIPTLF